MRPYDLILKKRNGKSLSAEELRFLVEGYSNGIVADYQMAAFLMASYFTGFTREETWELTKILAFSGERLDLSPIPGKKVDKHSTGGVGDKVTIALAPLVASVGLPFAKLAGKGLGHTGGTVDKLASIPGFRTELSKSEFIEQVMKVRVAVSGHSLDMAPADQKIYALRDVTATVDIVPLIAASVMSKKIAVGADALVLDVKVGKGAFAKDLQTAKELADLMIYLGSHAGLKTAAVLTAMDQPLGNAVGNAVEVKEAIATLKGSGPKDVTEVTLAIGSVMLVLAEVAPSLGKARHILEDKLASGQAVDKLRSWIDAQGGQAAVVDDPSILPISRFQEEVHAKSSGYVVELDAELIGKASMMLGSGRQQKEDQIDYGAGILVYKKVGDKVIEGEPLAKLISNNSASLKTASDMVQAAYTIGDGKPPSTPIVLDIILP